LAESRKEIKEERGRSQYAGQEKDRSRKKKKGSPCARGGPHRRAKKLKREDREEGEAEYAKEKKSLEDGKEDSPVSGSQGDRRGGGR